MRARMKPRAFDIHGDWATPGLPPRNPASSLPTSIERVGALGERVRAAGPTLHSLWLVQFLQVADEMNIFEAVVPAELREKVAVREAATNAASGVQGLVNDALALPEMPGYPRPLWKTALFSVPTGLVWYVGTRSVSRDGSTKGCVSPQHHLRIRAVRPNNILLRVGGARLKPGERTQPSLTCCDSPSDGYSSQVRLVQVRRGGRARGV